ncbi:MAG: phosphoserine transaminase [Spirochaetales bacterium]|nr:phosphoserine transaminase [Spirochaetales bacterium]
MRKYNFYAGPSTLPEPVLAQLKDEIVDYHDSGLSLIETSHRSKDYDQVHSQAQELIRDLLSVPEDYDILFLGGGATLQFSMVPMNLMQNGKSCDFVISGSWAKSAYKDAAKIGNVNVLFDGKDNGYTSLPDAASIKPGADSAYVHITANETIGGIQWQSWPETGKVPLVSDMSSEIMSRKIPVEKFGLIYAGAQKNLGPAGVTVVIIRKDIAGASPDSLTAYMSYKTHAEKQSLYNTPPVFAIWALKLNLEWVKAQGGVKAMEDLSKKKADLIYSAIDSSGGFYSSPVSKDCRSKMNIVFRLPSEDLEKEFVEKSAAAGMLGLKGHRSVGGIRASVYNALPVKAAEVLADLMKDFAKSKG